MVFALNGFVGHVLAANVDQDFLEAEKTLMKCVKGSQVEFCSQVDDVVRAVKLLTSEKNQCANTVVFIKTDLSPDKNAMVHESSNWQKRRQAVQMYEAAISNLQSMKIDTFDTDRRNRLVRETLQVALTTDMSAFLSGFRNLMIHLKGAYNHDDTFAAEDVLKYHYKCILYKMLSGRYPIQEDRLLNRIGLHDISGDDSKILEYDYHSSKTKLVRCQSGSEEPKDYVADIDIFGNIKIHEESNSLQYIEIPSSTKGCLNGLIDPTAAKCQPVYTESWPVWLESYSPGYFVGKYSRTYPFISTMITVPLVGYCAYKAINRFIKIVRYCLPSGLKPEDVTSAQDSDVHFPQNSNSSGIPVTNADTSVAKEAAVCISDEKMVCAVDAVSDEVQIPIAGSEVVDLAAQDVPKADSSDYTNADPADADDACVTQEEDDSIADLEGVVS